MFDGKNEFDTTKVLPDGLSFSDGRLTFKSLLDSMLQSQATVDFSSCRLLNEDKCSTGSGWAATFSVR
jgi:hypothetical protein